MRRYKKIIIPISFVLWTFVLLANSSEPTKKESVLEKAAKAPPVKVFEGEALKVKEEMEKLFLLSKKVNDKQERKEVREKIENSFDWETITQDCLGKEQTKKVGQGKKKEFTKLLQAVVTKTAYSRLDLFWKGASYNWESITIKGNRGELTAKFILQSGDEVELDYFILRKKGKWLVYDIAYEKQRYSTNINEQVSAFLKEKNFSELLSNLKKRLNELDSALPKEKESS